MHCERRKTRDVREHAYSLDVNVVVDAAAAAAAAEEWAGGRDVRASERAGGRERLRGLAAIRVTTSRDSPSSVSSYDTLGDARRNDTTAKRRTRRVRLGSHLLPCADGSTEIKGIRTRNAAR